MSYKKPKREINIFFKRPIKNKLDKDSQRTLPNSSGTITVMTMLFWKNGLHYSVEEQKRKDKPMKTSFFC